MQSRLPSLTNGRLGCFVAAIVVMLAAGCNRSNPYLATQPGGFGQPAATGGWQNPQLAAAGAADVQATAQIQELQRRLQLLDENNRQLTGQLASIQQQSDLHSQRAELLASQLQDASTQLQKLAMVRDQNQSALLTAQSRLSDLQTASNRQGNATLRPNTSSDALTEELRRSGFQTRVQDNNTRVVIPADQIFQANTSTLIAGATPILERLTAILSARASTNRIGVEAHAEAAAVQSSVANSAHQLTAMQASVILDHLQRSGRYNPQQLFSIGHGANHPIADASNPAGRASNRRIEIVVYPDTVR